MIKNNKFPVRIPVIILDLKTNKLIKFISINEAAKFLNTYPKAICRKLQTNKLLFNRYKIINNINNNIRDTIIYKLYYTCMFYLNIIFKYYHIIVYIILIILLLFIIYICIIYMIFIYINIINNYLHYINKINTNFITHKLDYSVLYNNNLLNYYEHFRVREKLNQFFDLKKEWKSEYYNINNKFNISTAIFDKANLDFSFTINTSIINSPIIEKINYINNSVNIPTPLCRIHNNPLGIQGLLDNKNYVVSILYNTIEHGNHNKELLNYQSNILYCLVNQLSPSLY